MIKGYLTEATIRHGLKGKETAFSLRSEFAGVAKMKRKGPTRVKVDWENKPGLLVGLEVRDLLSACTT